MPDFYLEELKDLVSSSNDRGEVDLESTFVEVAKSSSYKKKTVNFKK